MKAFLNLFGLAECDPSGPRPILLWAVVLLLSVAVPATSAAQTKPLPIAHFTDEAQKAGLLSLNVFGGKETKKYIIETTGTGVAIFDYDNDGWPDIFLVNGTTLESSTGKDAPTTHLYRNNHDGTFTDVTEKAGLAASGWGQGICVGDYDNDGWQDIYVTYYGHNRLFHNQHGVFEDFYKKPIGFFSNMVRTSGFLFAFGSKQSRARKSAQDAKWSFCLTAGTL